MIEESKGAEEVSALNSSASIGDNQAIGDSALTVSGDNNNNQTIGINAWVGIPGMPVAPWSCGQLIRLQPKKDTLSIKSELESIGLSRTVKKKESYFSKILRNIREFFTGW
jgi:hypothetical protein